MSNKRKPGKRSAEEKLRAVQGYENQPDEGSRGRFLRESGLYSVEIERWRAEMLAALKSMSNRNDPKDRRIKELERELRRKEKALAETAALLTLKKRRSRSGGTARTKSE